MLYSTEGLDIIKTAISAVIEDLLDKMEYYQCAQMQCEQTGLCSRNDIEIASYIENVLQQKLQLMQLFSNPAQTPSFFSVENGSILLMVTPIGYETRCNNVDIICISEKAPKASDIAKAYQEGEEITLQINGEEITFLPLE